MLTHIDRNLRSMRFELGRRWECQSSLSISAKENKSALRADFQNHLQPSTVYAVCYVVSYTLVPRAVHQLKWYRTGSVLSELSAACRVEFPWCTVWMHNNNVANWIWQTASAPWQKWRSKWRPHLRYSALSHAYSDRGASACALASLLPSVTSAMKWRQYP